MNKQKSIPNSLRTYRNRMGLRQLDVATQLGFCTTDRISKWEKGLSVPHIINLFRLCGIYEASPQQLYRELFEELYTDIQSGKNKNSD